MCELKKGDFVNYKLEDPSSINRKKEVTIQITKTPNDNSLFYEALRLDNNKPIPKNKEKGFNYEIIEIGNHHFEGLKAKNDSPYSHPTENSENNEEGQVIFFDFIIENLRFIQVYLQKKYGNPILRDRFFLLKNSNLKKQDYFKHFFKPNEDGIFDLKKDNKNENIKRMSDINQLFELLDSIKFNYNKKEIAQLKFKRS